jgi:glucan phosphoethanolaminetransferase (alkaline phosphatase superfamily)
LLTADPESLKLFLQQSGDEMIVGKINKVSEQSILLTLFAVFLNVIVSSDATTLEMKHSIYSLIMPKLLELIQLNKIDVMIKAHAIVLFLFLYRSSRKYRNGVTLPLDSIFEFISLRSNPNFPSATSELWYLIVLCNFF